MLNGFECGKDIPEDMLDFCFERDNIRVGRYRVLYGYRLRAGYMDDMVFELDICCGAYFSEYIMMLEKVTSIIDWNIKSNKDPFYKIPRLSFIKPYPKDIEFCSKIQSLYERSKKEEE